ncbi:aryl-alcohol dehydrogenase-like predicted oxidoreductase [Cricetibacter osteomyelitidis]|uniref:Aryl-alcohol dehydrogenase-like predicted oxidoreductase n=1 Tax=Cricetibacter osteomyelitidis TaxID=1521931 RepID=A0A4R2SZJ8_9PAST|nr:aldo/keto reductase [Cricetibacter osteomyelitidis]TCP95999.1 aryl-alcohol dehydrogenase-like predicted oxidoreductase [Cricetibacter osteomyelitidis]
MQSRTLGKELTVSAIGLGIMGMDHAYGQAADRGEMADLIRYSVELGGNFFDTAPIYGKANEMLLGGAVKGIRDKVVIATKFGIVGQSHSAKGVENVLDSRPEAIRKQVDESLANLQTDYIDLYYQHRIDPNVPPEAVAEVMNELMAAGKIRYWGVSNAPLDYMAKAHAVSPITATENQYSMLARQPEQGLFAFCEAHHIGFVAYSPLGNGFLSGRFNVQTQYGEGDFRRTMARFSPEVMAKNQAVLDLLHDLAAAKSATPSQIVLAWELAKSPISCRFPARPKNSVWRKIWRQRRFD